MAFDDIQTWWIDAFSDSVVQQFQQGASKLRGTVRQRGVTGASDFWERIGPTAAVKKVVRHGPTPQVDTPHSRRRADMSCWEWSDLLDKQDEYKVLLSPRSEYALAGGKALARAFDGAIISAFDSDSASGKDGSTLVTFASEAAGDHVLNRAFTVGDLIQASLDLNEHDVPEEGRHIVLPPAGFTQLLRETTTSNLTSIDRANLKALVKGQIEFFMGFHFHRSTLLPRFGPGLRYAYAYHEDAVGLSISSDISTTITERADLSYSTQILVAATLGAVRIQGEGVVRFLMDETK